ncbi:MAG TPA: hypothetical protein VGD56_13195 [Gemmatirosa sp.]
MKHLAAAVTIAAPADLCHRAAEASYADPRWHAAYAALRPGRTYSAHVTASEPARRLEITVAAVDALTGVTMPALGYRVVYGFAPAADGRTRAEVAIEYGTAAAVGGMGLLQPQAENEILHRLAGLLALEAGVRAGPVAAAI